ncbi:hypothetical protein [Thalassospira lucentensis]|uniref:hypothetical protein n=1 Tax=Thalassospira lucentensis TaxID=168935 RepID=UPI00142D8162|nr:hypothetical protein [Thalassospira lucentensis]NIZ01183.1 hypothetical protein [Thalassospira lucentensis]
MVVTFALKIGKGVRCLAELEGGLQMRNYLNFKLPKTACNPWSKMWMVELPLESTA